MIGTSWTEAEDAILRASYLAGGIAVAEAALPARSQGSIYHRTQRLGLSRRARWTTEQDDRLRLLWGLESIQAIAKAFGRTVGTVYWRAQKLDLTLGCPEGFEHLSDAGKRTGYAPKQLRQILAFSGVKLQRPWVRHPRKRAGVTWVVDPMAVDDAVAAWMATETLEDAARRRGLVCETLCRILARAKVEAKRTGIGKKCHRRALTSEIDRAIAEHAELTARTESVRKASRRLGVGPQTLRGWLEAAGVKRARGRLWEVDRLAVERVVRERMARAECRAGGAR